MVAHRRTGWAATVSTGATVTDRLVDMSRPDRVTSDPAICHGQPIICGLRYPVESLSGLLASGMTIEEVVDEYPDLERTTLSALLSLAPATGHRRVLPFDAA